MILSLKHFLESYVLKNEVEDFILIVKEQSFSLNNREKHGIILYCRINDAMFCCC